MDKAPPERSYQDQMQSFLQGSLPEQTGSPQTSVPAKDGSKP